MNTIIICIIIVGLLLLSFFSHLLLRFMKKSEATAKQEVAKNLSIINATQELQRFSTYLPYKSYALSHCLNHRLIDAAQGILDVDADNQVALSALQEANVVAENLDVTNESGSNGDEVNNWKFNGNEKKAIAFLKLIKRLKTTLKTEHTKGNISSSDFNAEVDKLDSLRTKINIENAKKMAQQAMKQSDYSSAIHILRKGIAYAENRMDQYAINALAELKKMLEDVSVSQSQKEQKLAEATPQDNMTQREREINQLFDKSKSYW